LRSFRHCFPWRFLYDFGAFLWLLPVCLFTFFVPLGEQSLKGLQIANYLTNTPIMNAWITDMIGISKKGTNKKCSQIAKCFIQFLNS
ncbi:hypothetical protein QP317_24500, partial [Escherichia coli]|nr:hypothetical protein [Escherichia coli]